MCYFIVTEILPASAILIILGKPTEKQDVEKPQYTHSYTPIPTSPFPQVNPYALYADSIALQSNNPHLFTGSPGSPAHSINFIRQNNDLPNLTANNV